MAEEKKESSSSKYGLGGLFIPAGIFIGMGVGFIIDNLVGGLFVGMGLGFFAFALTAIFARKDK